jgi:hypothetical protein
MGSLLRCGVVIVTVWTLLVASDSALFYMCCYHQAGFRSEQIKVRKGERKGKNEDRARKKRFILELQPTFPASMKM